MSHLMLLWLARFCITMLAFLGTYGCDRLTAEGEKGHAAKKKLPPGEKNMSGKIRKTEEDWKKELSAEEYQILRQKGTERAFTGKYYDHKEKGVYVCAACEQPLFSSDTKYDSGSGWPSFYAPISDPNVNTTHDYSHGMARTEIVCSRCGGHLGHVFDDGPKPTGLRYCVNSASLKFKP